MPPLPLPLAQALYRPYEYVKCRFCASNIWVLLHEMRTQYQTASDATGGL